MGVTGYLGRSAHLVRPGIGVSLLDVRPDSGCRDSLAVAEILFFPVAFTGFLVDALSSLVASLLIRIFEPVFYVFLGVRKISNFVLVPTVGFGEGKHEVVSLYKFGSGHAATGRRAIRPYDFPQRVVFTEYFIKHRAHVVSDVPIKMHVESSTIAEKFPYQTQPVEDHLEP